MRLPFQHAAMQVDAQGKHTQRSLSGHARAARHVRPVSPTPGCGRWDPHLLLRRTISSTTQLQLGHDVGRHAVLHAARELAWHGRAEELTALAHASQLLALAAAAAPVRGPRLLPRLDARRPAGCQVERPLDPAVKASASVSGQAQRCSGSAVRHKQLALAAWQCTGGAVACTLTHLTRTTGRGRRVTLPGGHECGFSAAE